MRAPSRSPECKRDPARSLWEGREARAFAAFDGNPDFAIGPHGPPTGASGPRRIAMTTLIPDLPGPKARALLARDGEVVSPSYPRDYPFAMSHGRGSEVW